MSDNALGVHGEGVRANPTGPVASTLVAGQRRTKLEKRESGRRVGKGRERKKN